MRKIGFISLDFRSLMLSPYFKSTKIRNTSLKVRSRNQIDTICVCAHIKCVNIINKHSFHFQVALLLPKLYYMVYYSYRRKLRGWTARRCGIGSKCHWLPFSSRLFKIIFIVSVDRHLSTDLVCAFTSWHFNTVGEKWFSGCHIIYYTFEQVVYAKKKFSIRM